MISHTIASLAKDGIPEGEGKSNSGPTGHKEKIPSIFTIVEIERSIILRSGHV